jgi:hypothetical protein
MHILSFMSIISNGGEIMNPVTEIVKNGCDACIGCVGCVACTPESDALFALLLTGTIGY